ncbi:MAG: endonuclease/exonuclease/phosphatase family protein [Gammaproteobacteria bacterium]|nr:endonuclease/exonuclease/phosphatase family protein [Gammaproteobacteria bacterium]
MFYSKIKSSKNSKRTAERLLRLKKAMRDNGLPVKCDNSFLLATWNIREFDSRSYGSRELECLYYIAEICSGFDLVAVQEVREDLVALETLLGIMGAHWRYVATDVTEGRAGNRERMAFLYDSRKVKFSGIAGEVVIPPGEIKKPSGKIIRYDPTDQLYRTPFLCGFQVGWSRVMLCTVHIVYGKDTPDDPKRVTEIAAVANFLAKRSRERQDYSNLILLGDFNIYSPQDATMGALQEAGFQIPKALQDVPRTNTGSKKRHYDQIACIPKRWNLEATGKAGVFNYYDIVYRDEDQAIYAPEMGDAYTRTRKNKLRDEKGQRRYYRTYWRTHQMSDHLPMWMEFRTDFSEEYLKEILLRNE